MIGYESIKLHMFNYEPKERTEKQRRKCFWKYFWNGFFFRKADTKYCPFCCNEIPRDDYFNLPIFTYGCEKCRTKLKE